MKRYYQLKFERLGGGTTSITVQNAKPTTPSVFSGAIDAIIASGAVKTSGDILTKLSKAVLCEQTVTTFDIGNM